MAGWPSVTSNCASVPFEVLFGDRELVTCSSATTSARAWDSTVRTSPTAPPSALPSVTSTICRWASRPSMTRGTSRARTDARSVARRAALSRARSALVVFSRRFLTRLWSMMVVPARMPRPSARKIETIVTTRYRKEITTP